MAKATVELDFFGMEKESSSSSSKSQFQKFLDRQRSIRGMQSAISKINPEVLKSVIGSGSVNNGSGSVPSSPNREQILFPVLPVCSAPTLRPSSENLSDSAPLTIFYNGTVSIFDVPRDKAETILKLAVDGTSKAVENTLDPKIAVPSSGQEQLLQTLNGDLPIARHKSLQRFLEKRKERLTSVSPYSCYT
ncbi:protein TIFY 9 [Quercus lobata]|uniref:Protein TIFY n=1 Tax=Quercus lobata TaxID=97700 RepID=A0A7N2L9Y3_QUELO|nr:protein TIFY 9 [Quercus lobata]